MSLPNLVIAGIAAMLFLAFGIIVFVVMYQRRVIHHQLEIKVINDQKQMELTQASIDGEETERKRIAAELHDDVGVTLSSIRLFLHQAAKENADKEVLNETKKLLDESIQKIRSISHQLQPGSLQYLGLGKAIQSLTEVINRSDSITAEFIEEDRWQQQNENLELSLYRIIQELINNVLKHARASKIVIRKNRKGDMPCITLWHNGNGLTGEQYQEMLFKKDAIGLKNIENRVKSSGLIIVFEKNAADGYTCEIGIPSKQ